MTFSKEHREDTALIQWILNERDSDSDREWEHDFAHSLAHLTLYCRIAQDYSTQINKKRRERDRMNRVEWKKIRAWIATYQK